MLKLHRIIFVLFILFISCKHNVAINSSVCETDEFNIIIESGEINRINEKKILNKIINYTSIKYNPSSEMTLKIKINIIRNTSIISKTNLTVLENVKYNVYYQIFYKLDDKPLEEGNIVIINDIKQSTKYFANYVENSYLIDNITNAFGRKLENKINSFLEKCVHF